MARLFEEFTALNDPRYDFPERAAAPTFVYAVCSTPRSGSSLLCHRLWETGVAGAPWEYFNPRRIMPDLAKRLGTNSIAEYIPALMRLRTSPNGVFGAKLHPSHAVPEVMTVLRPRRMILIEREDKVAQAVSFVRALQTDRWSSRGTEKRAAEYDYVRLFAVHQFLVRAQKEWRRALARAGDRVLHVTYEAMLMDPGEVLARCLRHLRLRGEGKAVELPILKRLSEPAGDPWCRRYLEDFTRLGAPPAAEQQRALKPQAA